MKFKSKNQQLVANLIKDKMIYQLINFKQWNHTMMKINRDRIKMMILKIWMIKIVFI